MFVRVFIAALVLGSFVSKPSLSLADEAGNSALAQWRPIEAHAAASNLKVTGRITAGEGALKIESAAFAGRVVNILTKEGDRVARGTPLLEVSGAECISLAEERRVATSHQLTDMVQAANARAEQLHLQIRGTGANAECILVSAHAATVLKRNVEVGTAFNIGDALVTLLDTAHLSAEFDVNERDLSLVQTGLRVKFQIAGDSSPPFESKITNIIPSIDAVTRVARVRVGAIHFTRPTLEAQLVGEIIVPVQARAKLSSDDSFEVAPQAVVFAQNKRYVVKGSNEKPVAAEVRVISEDAFRAYIQPLKRDDLKKGDQIATTQAMYLLKRALPGTME